ncbi:hypothetical protein KAR91_65700 [Candidatus Pacearchaeota archaeon]|nr:hypothetical protein [Candidatus Pacearchaeota archaeon]
MSIDELVSEMQEVKTKHPTLEIDQILKMFQIQAMQNLTKVLRMSNG